MGSSVPKLPDSSSQCSWGDQPLSPSQQLLLQAQMRSLRLEANSQPQAASKPSQQAPPACESPLQKPGPFTAGASPMPPPPPPPPRVPVPIGKKSLPAPASQGYAESNKGGEEALPDMDPLRHNRGASAVDGEGQRGTREQERRRARSAQRREKRARVISAKLEDEGPGPAPEVQSLHQGPSAGITDAPPAFPAVEPSQTPSNAPAPESAKRERAPRRDRHRQEQRVWQVRNRRPDEVKEAPSGEGTLRPGGDWEAGSGDETNVIPNGPQTSWGPEMPPMSGPERAPAGPQGKQTGPQGTSRGGERAARPPRQRVAPVAEQGTQNTAVRKDHAHPVETGTQKLLASTEPVGGGTRNGAARRERPSRQERGRDSPGNCGLRTSNALDITNAPAEPPKLPKPLPMRERRARAPAGADGMRPDGLRPKGCGSTTPTPDAPPGLTAAAPSAMAEGMLPANAEGSADVLQTARQPQQSSRGSRCGFVLLVW